MKSLSKNISLLLALVFALGMQAQTKKEKTVQAKGGTIGMYNSSQNKDAVEFFDKGEGFSKTRDFKGSVKWYKKAIDKDPKFVEAYDNLGVAYRNMGDFDNAKKCYNKSIELFPDGPMAHQNLGLLYSIEKNYDKAIEQYKELQRIDSTDAEGFYGTVQIYLNQNKYDDAIKSAAKTLEIYEATKSPYLSDGQYLLGLSYYYKGDKKNASTYLKQAKNSGVKVPKSICDELGI
jgi:tetratricopeptide (TPR) repeat protein